MALVSSQIKNVVESGKIEGIEAQNAKKYFSILLAEHLDKEKGSKVTLPTQTMKTLYTLVFLKNRKLKNKLIDVLNIFKSIERRITLDVYELEMRENLLEVSISENSELKSRRDKIEEIDNELYVKDSLGEYVYYDCVLKEYEKHKK